MANRLSLSSGGPAATFYNSLNPEERRSLDVALEYIRDVPFEHGGIITKRFMSPLMIYVYEDAEWKISYGLSFRPGHYTEYDIGIWSIARV